MSVRYTEAVTKIFQSIGDLACAIRKADYTHYEMLSHNGIIYLKVVDGKVDVGHGKEREITSWRKTPLRLSDFEC